MKLLDYRNEFIAWYNNDFKNDSLYKVMTCTVEDSPWHREGNVGIHTDMVVGQYLSRISVDIGDVHGWLFSHQAICGAFAAAFHDVAKPHSMQVKYTEARGEYRAFNGHEPRSARMWEDWALRNWNMLVNRFNMHSWDVYRIGWMIENHLPWDMKKEDKLNNLAMTVHRLDIRKVFTTFLMADSAGRISDDYAGKLEKSDTWTKKFDIRVLEVGKTHVDSLTVDKSCSPVIAMPIAPSGSGKSTLYNEEYWEFVKFSLDDERYTFASQFLNRTEGVDDKTWYSICWGYCDDHKEDFNAFWQAKYIKLIKSGANVFLDNTNLSRKSRRFWLAAAENHGYWKKAILMPVTKLDCQNAQFSRGDKKVPYQSVSRQYMDLQLPWYGEFDEITLVPRD